MMTWASLRRSVTAAFVFGLSVPSAGEAQDSDLALVLAVDISYSVGPFELDLQRRGYIDAFRSDDVIDAITSGPIGTIAVTYLEWGGPGTQPHLVPWTRIDGRASANAFADRLQAAPLNRSDETSISAALQTSMSLFADAPSALRRVIDLSADGYNNSGPAVLPARDAVIAAGITINGLPIVNADAPDLEIYFRECVIGGPGAVLFTVSRPEDFATALRRKMIWEISGRVQARVVRAAAADCNLGERRAREDYLRQLDDLTHGRSERWRPRQEDWPEPD